MDKEEDEGGKRENPWKRLFLGFNGEVSLGKFTRLVPCARVYEVKFI